jgi:hypothetical protein
VAVDNNINSRRPGQASVVSGDPGSIRRGGSYFSEAVDGFFKKICAGGYGFRLGAFAKASAAHRHDPGEAS